MRDTAPSVGANVGICDSCALAVVRSLHMAGREEKTVEARTAVISEATKFVNNALEVLFLRNGDLRIC